MRINQKINFYSDEFKPPVIALSADKMLQYMALVLVLLALVSAALYYPIVSQETQVAQLKTRLAEKQNELEDAKRKYPKKLINPAFETQLEELKADNSNKQRLLNYLQSDTLKHAQNFSEVFRDLKTYDHNKVWLTRVDVLNEGQSIRLTGLVSRPDVLPGYIDGLKEAYSFKGRSFNLFNLERDQDNKAYLHFILSTESGRGEDEG